MWTCLGLYICTLSWAWALHVLRSCVYISVKLVLQYINVFLQHSDITRRITHHYKWFIIIMYIHCATRSSYPTYKQFWLYISANRKVHNTQCMTVHVMAYELHICNLLLCSTKQSSNTLKLQNKIIRKCQLLVGFASHWRLLSIVQEQHPDWPWVVWTLCSAK